MFSNFGIALASNVSVVFVKALKQLILMGMLAVVAVVTAHGADKKAATVSNDQVRLAVSLFQDQKAEFLAQQKEARSIAKQVRADARELRKAETTATAQQARDEARKSVENAKQLAIEQSRKLAEEAAQIAQDARKGR